MTRVAVVHNLKPGGAARRLEGTLRQMAARQDLELREFTLSMGRTSMATMGSGRRMLPQHVVDYEPSAPTSPRLLRPPLRYADLLRLRRRWGKLAKDIAAWQPDVVFANPCGLLLAAPPVSGRLSEIPIVYYCDEPRRHDYESAAHDSTNRGTRGLYWAMRAWEKSIDRSAINAATLLATNSTHSQQGIVTAYGRDAVVVPPGVDEVFTAASAPRALPRHCLSVGSLIPSKGHDLAIAAVARSGVTLPLIVVAPRDNADERRRLSELADSAGVFVKFRFGISDLELADLYRSALATLYLARAEPLGLVSLESQACGTPCIVSDEGGLPSTVRDNVTGRIVARNNVEPGRALAELASPAEQTRLRAAISDSRIRRNSDMVDELLQLLEKARVPA